MEIWIFKYEIIIVIFENICFLCDSFGGDGVIVGDYMDRYVRVA